MKRTIEERECNKCKKVEQRDNVPRFGGIGPFDGWMSVERTNGQMMLSHGTDLGPWDFCCNECLVQFFFDGHVEEEGLRNEYRTENPS